MTAGLDSARNATFAGPLAAELERLIGLIEAGVARPRPAPRPAREAASSRAFADGASCQPIDDLCQRLGLILDQVVLTVTRKGFPNRL